MEPRNLEADADRPPAVRSLRPRPTELWIAGELDPSSRAIAIVGARRATKDARAFARELAAAVARTGTVVVSGGARGIDGEAHRGALDAGGRTWCVAPTGYGHTFPKEHAPLFEEVAQKGGAMIWPFPPASSPEERGCFARRNGVLVALAQAVVIVQAGIPSGSLNAATWCRSMERPLYVVGAFPWSEGFEGSRMLLEAGARPLCSIDGFLVALGLREKQRRDRRVVHGLPKPATMAMDPTSVAVLGALGAHAVHVDELVLKSGLPTAAVSTALLTLALENVVVEGPSGFFRRAHPTQTLNITNDIVNRS